MKNRTAAGRKALFIFLLFFPTLTISTPAFPLPLQAQSGPTRPDRGLFLVADPTLFDDRFKETVVLITHVESTGTIGVIINRPTETTLAHALSGLTDNIPRDDVLYFGGPVMQERVVLLLRSQDRPDSAEHVFDNVYFGQRLELLEEMERSPGEGEMVRVYAGHAGWGPGQLEREIDHGWWRVIKANSRAIFDMEPSSVWQEMMASSSRQWISGEGGRIPHGY